MIWLAETKGGAGHLVLIELDLASVGGFFIIYMLKGQDILLKLILFIAASSRISFKVYRCDPF